MWDEFIHNGQQDRRGMGPAVVTDVGGDDQLCIDACKEEAEEVVKDLHIRDKGGGRVVSLESDEGAHLV
jgi:hypothetical protein